MLNAKQISTVRRVLETNEYNFNKFSVVMREDYPDIHAYLKGLNTEGRGIKRIDVFGLLNPKATAACAECKAKTKFGENGIFGYAKFCSKQCSNRYNSRNGIFKAGMLEKYGVDNPSKSKKFQAKKRKTCMKNYGVEFPQQSKEVRKTTIKAIKAKYGVDNVSELKSVQKKRERTMIKRFGTANVMHNPDMLEHTMYQAHRIKKLKLDGKEFNYMGYEGRFIEYLVKNVGVPVKNISTRAKDMPEIFYKISGKQKKYTPDVTFKHKGKTWVVEVKSVFTGGLLQNNRQVFSVLRRKALAASEKCNFAVVYISEKGDKMKIIRDFSDFNRRAVKKKVLSSFAR